jgi:hypothetical protein
MMQSVTILDSKFSASAVCPFARTHVRPCNLQFPAELTSLSLFAPTSPQLIKDVLASLEMTVE